MSDKDDATQVKLNLDVTQGAAPKPASKATAFEKFAMPLAIALAPAFAGGGYALAKATEDNEAAAERLEREGQYAGYRLERELKLERRRGDRRLVIELLQIFARIDESQHQRRSEVLAAIEVAVNHDGLQDWASDMQEKEDARAKALKDLAERVKEQGKKLNENELLIRTKDRKIKEAETAAKRGNRQTRSQAAAISKLRKENEKSRAEYGHELARYSKALKDLEIERSTEPQPKPTSEPTYPAHWPPPFHDSMETPDYGEEWRLTN